MRVLINNEPNERMKKPHLSLLLVLGAIFACPLVAADGDGNPAPEKDTGRKAPEADQNPAGKRDPGPAAPANPQDKKGAKVFVAYDSNKDGLVSDGEIVAMMEGKQNSSGRREIRKAVDRADKDNNGALDFDEFQWWYQTGRLDDRARNR